MKLNELECSIYKAKLFKFFLIQTIVTPANTVSPKRIYRAF